MKCEFCSEEKEGMNCLSCGAFFCESCGNFSRGLCNDCIEFNSEFDDASDLDD